MKQLETLLTERGLTEHMEALSDWRDGLLIEKAAEIQQLHASHASAIASAVAEKEAEIGTLTATVTELNDALTPLRALYTEWTAKVSAALASGDPEKFIALGVQFITPEKERRRAELEAELAALDS